MPQCVGHILLNRTEPAFKRAGFSIQDLVIHANSDHPLPSSVIRLRSLVTCRSEKYIHIDVESLAAGQAPSPLQGIRSYVTRVAE